MNSTHNDGKSGVVKRFIKIWKGKSYEKLTANNSKSCLGYLNQLVDEYNNTYHSCIGRNSIDADHSAFSEKTDTNPKVSEFKVGDRVRIIMYKIILAKA